MNRFPALILALCFLAACGTSRAEKQVATQVAVEQAAAATLTALAPTATATPSPTPTSTPSPSPTPTMTPTPTPTSTPTVLPNVQLETAQGDQVNGEYVQAILAYSNLLDDEPTPGQARQAAYHLAESYLLEREYVAAALAWEEFIARYPDDSRLPQARLMAARAYQAADLCDEAISHYQAYQATETVLNDLIYEWIGDCHAASARLAFAIGAYRQALGSTKDPSTQVSLREKIANAYLALDDPDAAVAEYDAILEIAQIDDYRAKIEYLAGQALDAAGQTDAAFDRYRRAVEDYPQAEYAYLSLVELVYGGAQVNDFQRGLVDYYAGATYPDAYGAAILAFDRYLSTAPAEKADRALYYQALAQRAVGKYSDALDTLERLIAGYPDSDVLVQAWLEKGATLAQAGDDDAAVQAYQNLAASFPDSSLAPEALWRAAQLRQEEEAYAEAAELYEALQAGFASSEDADVALWYGGLARYRSSDVEKAIGDWQTLLDKYPDSIYGPKTLYWLGKVGASPKAPEAAGYWDRLLAEIPDTYYGLRVQQIRAGESLTATQPITASVEPPAWDGARFEAEILRWLRSWTQVPTGTVALTVPVTVAQGLDLARGEALLGADLRTEALQALDRARSSVNDDPLGLAALGRFFRDQGLYGLAASCAARIADLWPGGDLHDAPLALRYLAYPLAYADVLSAEAQSHNLDPLLLAALVRQESLFEPAAESWVGARGLGQVMPSTGEEIARELGMGDFVPDDLYRPSVSLRFAATYLTDQLQRFDNRLFVALAAYNGGPGNALIWWQAAGGDLDLFVEGITAVQSRLYLQGVYEQYVTYEELYRPAGE